MRLLLALAILCSHAKLIAGDSDIAEALAKGAGAVTLHDHRISGVLRPFKVAMVPVFFALSGFLVTGSALRLRDVRKYLLFRSLRIFPALTVEVALSAMLLGPLFTTYQAASYFSDKNFFLYFGNILGFVHMYLPGVFLGNPWKAIVNINLWTLPAEFYCYLIISLAMISNILYNRSFFISIVLISSSILIVLSLAAGIWVKPGIYPTAAIVYYFFLGSTFYLYRECIPSSWLLFIVAAIFSYALLMFEEAVFVAPIYVVYCTIFFGTQTLFRVPILKDRDYSYGIYLYGFPIAQALIVLLPDLQGRPWIFVPLACLAAFSFAALSWHFVERPLLAMKRLFLRDRTRAVAINPDRA